MTSKALRGFYFKTPSQWRSCRFVQVDADALERRHLVRPFMPFARPGTLHASDGAFAPAVTAAGEVLWRDSRGRIHTRSGCDDPSPAPSPLAQATRIVSTPESLWAVAPPSAVHRVDEESLSRLVTVELPDAAVVDLAGDGRGEVLALVLRSGRWQCVRVDASGAVGEPVDLEGLPDATAFVFLRHARRFVVLSAATRTLYWFDVAGGAPRFSVTAAALRPCFEPSALGSDDLDRILLAGAEGPRFGGGRYVLLLDADGNAVGDVPIDARDGETTGVTGTGSRLFVTGDRGLVEFRAADIVPRDLGGVECTVVTPALEAPEPGDGRRWLRVEVQAELPEGSTLEITCASTDRVETRDRLAAMLANESWPEHRRLRELRAEPDVWHPPVEFHGAGESAGRESTCAARLFDIRDRWVMVLVTLRAAPGARLPGLSSITVLYPGRTLMERLPAVYRAEEERPDSFLRHLVGVLETTTQSLDRRIGSMGSRIHPATSPGPWLDYTARWLGLPWDDELSLAQKRAIVGAAPVLAANRGTRVGLEALLAALVPGRPPRYRVTDATADHGFAVVGGPGCDGSRLPAMLAGHTRWNAELGSRSVLGHMRLPCEGQVDDGVWQLAGRVRVEVAASPVERKRWTPWMQAVLAAMVPLTARLDLQWVHPRAFRSNRLDATIALESAPAARLGADALTGVARLPRRRARLSSSGTGFGTRLG